MGVNGCRHVGAKGLILFLLGAPTCPIAIPLGMGVKGYRHVGASSFYYNAFPAAVNVGAGAFFCNASPMLFLVVSSCNVSLRTISCYLRHGTAWLQRPYVQPLSNEHTCIPQTPSTVNLRTILWFLRHDTACPLWAGTL